MSARLRPCWLPARRFCIRQGTKEKIDPESGRATLVPRYRLIDDYSEVGHNSAAIVLESITT
eukprot:900103-Heterocapsa_arctica.AAC.1